MKEEDCIGCLDDKELCRWFDKFLRCPCSICLIKMVCKHRCEALIEYSKVKDKI